VPAKRIARSHYFRGHPSLNETDENRMKPLPIAIDFGQPACVGLLLEAGADRKAREKRRGGQVN